MTEREIVGWIFAGLFGGIAVIQNVFWVMTIRESFRTDSAALRGWKDACDGWQHTIDVWRESMKKELTNAE